jgi:type IV pilus assembly protein PilA
MSARLKGEKGEAGFTLIELLVVMLILGILAAIAIPAFFNQRDKGTDAQAKAAARTAQTAIETYATDHGGSYEDADEDALAAIEDTLQTAGDNAITVAGPLDAAGEPTDEPTDAGYTVTSTAGTTNTFSISRTDGDVTFSCTTLGDGGCPDDDENGDWSQ